MPASMPTRALPAQVDQIRTTFRTTARPLPHPAVPALFSAVLLYLAYPPADRGYLGWFALSFVFSLVRSDRPSRSLYLGAWVGGFAFWLLAVSWIRWIDDSAWIAWLSLALYHSFYWPLFLLVARLAVGRLRLPLMLAAPIAWVGLEYVRAHALTGFPWYYLAHTQYQALPVIQVADLAGVWGLGLLVAAVNAWWVDLLTLPIIEPGPRGPRLARGQLCRFGALAIALAATLGYGFFRLRTAEFREGPRLALLQSNAPQDLSIHHDPNQTLQTFANLVRRAVRDPRRPPDLIVWPETAYPYGVVRVDPRLDPSAFGRLIRAQYPEDTVADWRDRQTLARRVLQGWADETGVPMLVGSITYDFRPSGLDKYNSAVLFEPGRPQSRSYHKIHLVPFGEFVPLARFLPLLGRLTPYQGSNMPSLAVGSGPVAFDLGGVRYVTAICFEDTVPYVVRRSFAELKGKQPDVLLNLTNDGWFKGSIEHEMHLAVSVFRAVENRVPLARAANLGISALVDGNGRIVRALPKGREGVLDVEIPLDDRTGLYSRWGDWLGQTCLAIGLGLTILALFRGRRSSAFARGGTVG